MARAVTGMKVCVNPVQALVRNAGTCRSDAKGDPQVEDPRGVEYRCGAKGRMGSS